MALMLLHSSRISLERIVLNWIPAMVTLNVMGMWMAQTLLNLKLISLERTVLHARLIVTDTILIIF